MFDKFEINMPFDYGNCTETPPPIPEKKGKKNFQIEIKPNLTPITEPVLAPPVAPPLPPPPPPPPAMTVINPAVNLPKTTPESTCNNKLLDEIRRGKTLKKCVTIDRSTPSITNKSQTVPSSNDQPSKCSTGGAMVRNLSSNALQDELKNTLRRRQTKDKCGDSTELPITTQSVTGNFLNNKTATTKNTANLITLPKTITVRENSKLEFASSQSTPTQIAEMLIKAGDTEKTTQNVVTVSPKIEIKREKIKPDFAAIQSKPIQRVENITVNKSHVADAIKKEITTEKLPIKLKSTVFTQNLTSNAQVKSKISTINRKESETELNNISSSVKAIKAQLNRTESAPVPHQHGVKAPQSAPSIQRLKTQFSQDKKTSNVVKQQMINHGKPNFIVNRSNSKSEMKNNPAFKVFKRLESMEDTQKPNFKSKPYISFSKDTQDSSNIVTETVTTTKTVIVRQDLMFENLNLRDIKIDIDNSFKIVKS